MADRVTQRWVDPVIEVYKRDVDRTLLRENLRRTLDERFLGLQQMQRAAEELQQAMREANSKPSPNDSIIKLEALREEREAGGNG